MARRGDGIYLRRNTWWLDFTHEGTRHVARLGKGLLRSDEGTAAIHGCRPEGGTGESGRAGRVHRATPADSLSDSYNPRSRSIAWVSRTFGILWRGSAIST
jgi:hypothetical protein